MAKKKVITPLPEGEKVEYKLFHETSRKAVDALIHVYKINPHNARVKFFNEHKEYTYRRLVLFEKGKSNFEISWFRVKYGISTTNRMYHHQKKEISIIYTKGKFYYINKRANISKIQPLTYGLLSVFITETEGGYGNEAILKSKTFQYLKGKFHWLQVVSEHPMKHSFNLNRVISDKLFGYKDLSRFVFKVPNNIAEIVMKSNWKKNVQCQPSKIPRIWLEVLKLLDNVQNLTPELLNSQYFQDSCKMAKTLGRKINCSWGEKRLKDEHDMWAREITNIVFDCEPEYSLNVKPIYKLFAEFSGFELLKTNKDLLREGMMQNHCVGTYINQVKSGSCAIYHVEGFTLQIKIKMNNVDVENDDGSYTRTSFESFENLQFKGKRNIEAPKELHTKVQAEMDRFKAENMFDKEKIDDWSSINQKDESLDVFGNGVIEVDDFYEF